jgi:hypothetical protein
MSGSSKRDNVSRSGVTALVTTPRETPKGSLGSHGVTALVTATERVLVKTEALELANSLKARGFALSAIAGQLWVKPAAQLTADDTAAITRWKWHLLAIAAVESGE